MSETKSIQTIGVVGTGLMGTGIAECAATSGFRTILVKATPGSVDAARAKIEKSLGKSVEKGKLAAEARDAALANLTFTGDRAALATADLVIESVPEDMATKRSLFHSLHALTPASTSSCATTSPTPPTPASRAWRGCRTRPGG